jgi:hypothetical protein
LLLGFVYLLSFAGLGYLAWSGWSYYTAPLVLRPRHSFYWALKPGGSVGYTLGVTGTFLMVVMHAYTLRRRVPALRGWGAPRTWLDFHIYCGIIGPLLIVFHSSFKFRGLVAIAFWSMVAVALSGVLGRYLYAQIPRRRSGDELTLSEVEDLDRRTTERLQQEFGVLDADLNRLRRISTGDIARSRGLLSLLVGLPFHGLTLRLRLRRFAHGLELPPGETPRHLLRVMRQKALLERRIMLWRSLQQLFHYWHVIHKPFAIVMYLFTAVHIAVVFATGYGMPH